MATTYPISFSAQLRQHLRGLRKKRGLTQAQLGALIGVSQVRIAEIEANPGLVSFDQLMQLLSMLGVSISLSDPHETRSRNMIASEAGRGLGSNEEMRKLASAAGLGLGSNEEMRKLASAAGLGLGSNEEMRKLASAAGLGLGSNEEMRKLASAAGLGLGKLKKGSW